MFQPRVYYLVPLWFLALLHRKMNMFPINKYFKGLPAWRRRDGTEVWICYRKPQTQIDNIRAHTQQVHKCPKCGAWVNCHTAD